MDLTGFEDLIGQEVVIDTRTPMLYIGKLAAIETALLFLEQVDVHDSTESQATKERYVIEAKKHGIKVNRRSARVVGEVVVSITPLEDIVAL